MEILLPWGVPIHHIFYSAIHVGGMVEWFYTPTKKLIPPVAMHGIATLELSSTWLLNSIIEMLYPRAYQPAEGGERACNSRKA